MSEAPGDPSVQTQTDSQTDAPVAPPAPEAPAPRERRAANVQTLLEAGAHFGHQTRRWNPEMKPFIFGDRNGIHIIDLDQTVPRLVAALEFLREIVAQGGKVLFVGTKRQAQAPVCLEAERCGQFYVNNRWLGGMLTNFRTVRKSIDHFKELLSLVEDEERVGDLSKKELSRINRSITKYRKSLDGIREMAKLPDALFVVDILKEHIAISEARRLGIPIVAVIDTNCSPKGIDFPIPANDDAIRAIQLYCELASDACQEGAELFNARVQSEEAARPREAKAEGTGLPTRRVVEIKQPATRRHRQPGGTHSAAGRRRGPAPEEAPAEGGEAASPPGRESQPTPEGA